jgi:hypothetical protein
MESLPRRTFQNAQQDGLGTLAAIAIGPQMKEASPRTSLARGGDEELPLGLVFDNQQAIEADIVHVDTVRQVAPTVFSTQLNA